MRKAYLGLAAVAALAACQSSVPDSNPQGAGFQDYNSYVRNRAAGVPMQGSAYGAQGGVMGEGVATQPMASTGFSPDAAAAAIAAAEGGSTAPMNATGLVTGGQTVASGAALPPIDPACQGRGQTMAGIQETTSEMNYASGGVSDEQDFGAVTQRESIESDKQRIACNRQQYVVVQPGAIPQRPGDEGPNIAAYALATTNAPGVKLYTRPPFYLTNPEKACAKFTSSDKAQQAFLAAGGPQRDSKALDPDGDGFACSWDPRPFRAAAQ
ncbi:hypothetical protein [Stagnihabitans tardus]|uniref:Excalibur calcium-binding domain-containing protein n=1 Tax=Stagnihabitans tardus TaxID=2699202 RepID=A0AAE4Y9T9_9RHOB|nr:hypothetical protein [Stagnihabitans tardus]NBZ88662.1 hypothetical protein [Stagnihabitans tardus]